MSLHPEKLSDAYRHNDSASSRDLRLDQAIGVISASDLHRFLPDSQVKIVDARKGKDQNREYIPGSVAIDPDSLYRHDGATQGLMPHPAEFASMLSAIGVQPGHHVVVYDDETGVDAARLVWLLDAIGHERQSLLSGGFEAWMSRELPVTNRTTKRTTSLYPVRKYRKESDSTSDQVLKAIDDNDVAIIDSRSIAEFNGLDVRAARGGRIPGAIHLEWGELIDYYETGEVLAEAEIVELLSERGISREQPIIAYCQSNRRSALTYVVLKSLGYNISTYAGSWSEWGNDPQLPVER